MQNSNPPKVTVITTTYNGARFLATTIESILNQSFEDFEYVIVDDASTDASQEIINSYQKEDHRILSITNPTNLGPPGALNKALDFARGEYIAILDHDDLALPERLERQVAFLDANPQIGVLGCQMRFIDEEGEDIGDFRFSTNPIEAHWLLLFGVSLLHSTFLYRHSLIYKAGGYSEQHDYMCDYELLVRMAEHCQITNLSDVLVYYRSSPSQISARFRKPQSGQVVLFQYAIQKRWLNLQPDLSAFSALHNWVGGLLPSTKEEFVKAMEYLEMLFAQYCANFVHSDEAYKIISHSCSRRWLRMAHHAYEDHRTISKACWQKVKDLDPLILRRQSTWDLLRKLKSKNPQDET